MAIDILHNAILGRTKDLSKGFFSETSARSSFLEKFKTFHSEGAVKSRAVSVAQRQKEEKAQAYLTRDIVFTDGTTMQNAMMILQRRESDWDVLMVAHRLFQRVSLKRVQLEQCTERQ